MQLSEYGFGLRNAHRQADDGLGEFVEMRAGIHDEVAESVEFLYPRVEFAICLAARGNDLDEHRPSLIGGFGNGVVEPLTDLEGRGQSFLCVVVRRDEGSGCRIAEFASGEG
ncbi:hypothetical protein RhoFasSB10_00343 [Rhodococcus fascians]|nr:hypothetical protein [Rhodococcus fascians]